MKLLIKKHIMIGLVTVLTIFPYQLIAEERAGQGEADAFTIFKEGVAQLGTNKGKSISAKDLKSTRAFIEIFSMILAQNRDFGSNPSETIRLIEEAANMDIACAQYALSTFYRGLKIENPETGKVQEYVKQDKQAELKWLKKAAKGDCKSAYQTLGFKYGEGRIVTENHQESAYWFKEAALRGFPDAMVITSINYGTGKGLKKDKIQSLTWIILGIKYIENDPKMLSDAQKLKKSMEEELDLASVTAAQKAAEKLDKRIQAYLKPQS